MFRPKGFITGSNVCQCPTDAHAAEGGVYLHLAILPLCQITCYRGSVEFVILLIKEL